jgi:L-threonylcarbamoyladenylate synthase
MTQIFTIHPDHPQADLILEAARAIRRGGLVAFPTETVYGLGANGLDADAVRRIFAAKQRPSSDPLILHLSSAADLERVAILEGREEIVSKLAARTCRSRSRRAGTPWRLEFPRTPSRWH